MTQSISTLFCKVFKSISISRRDEASRPAESLMCIPNPQGGLPQAAVSARQRLSLSKTASLFILIIPQ